MRTPAWARRAFTTITRPSPRRWHLLNRPTLTDASGQAHDWRADLTAALAKRQNRDGSWVNPADRFLEGDPNLVTAYGLLALAYARPKR